MTAQLYIENFGFFERKLTLYEIAKLEHNWIFLDATHQPWNKNRHKKILKIDLMIYRG